MPHLEKLPADIPSKPDRPYANKGWSGYGDWLGTGTIAPRLRKYRSFQQARGFAWKLKLKNGTEWRAYCKGEMPHLGRLPADIPAKPDNTYAEKGWLGMGDWLGTGTIATRLRKYRSFQQARDFVRKLGLISVAEWRAFCKGDMPHLEKLPADIPVNPDQKYANKGWSGYGDWLGTNRTRASKSSKRKS
jgi:thiol-disulfide isomerase/thioredoxin